MPEASAAARLLQSDPVVITGMGAVSAAGSSAEGLWKAARGGLRPARWLDLPVPAGGTERFAGYPAVEPEWTGHPWALRARRLDAAGQWALHAAHAAAAQAGLLEKGADPERLGVMCGSSRGPMGKWEQAYGLLAAGRRIRPTMAATTTLAAGTGSIAQALGALGPSSLVSAACASGAYAIAAAAEQILLGHADIMLAGGMDDALHAVIGHGLRAAGVLADGEGEAADLCRPFGTGRSGLVPGSGAGILVLESLSSAQRRGAVPLAVLSGWAVGTDPQGLAGIEAHGAGLQRVMRGALTVAGLEKREIGYLNAHGTGTVANDAAEAAAIREVFGGSGPPCASTKPVTGHCLGATPALEAIIGIHSLQKQEIPPAGPGEVAADCAPLRLAGGGAAPGLRHFMSTSAAFWGFHAALILSLPGDGPSAAATF